MVSLSNHNERYELQKGKEPENLRMHLRTLQPQGNLLRLRYLSPAEKTGAGLLFPQDAERTYDRSFENFADLVAKKRI